MSLREVPNYAQKRTVEMIKQELITSDCNAKKVARHMRREW